MQPATLCSGLTVLVLLLSSSIGGTCPLNDPLQCYLFSRTIKVPDQCAEVSGSELCTSNVVVTQLTLTAVPSQYSPSRPYDIIVSADNAGAQVSGSYKYGKFISGSITGSVLMTLSIDVNVATVPWESLTMPASVGFSSCSFPTMSVDIKFDNSVLNAFSKVVDKSIQAAIEKEVCTTLPQQLSTKTADEFSNKLDPFLEKLISVGPSVPPALDPASYVNWSDSPLGKISNFIQWFQSSRIPQCIEETHPAITLPFIPSLVDNVIDSITNGTGSVTLPLNMSFTLGRRSHNSTVTFQSVTFSGLNTVSQLTLFKPANNSPLALTSSFALAALGVSMDIFFSTTPPTYSEKLVAKGKIENVVFSTEMVVAVQKQHLDSLYLDQVIAAPKCILSMVDALNVTSLILDMTVGQLIVQQITGSTGALETDILSFVNNSVALVTTGFSDLLTGVVAGFVQGPARTSINKAVAHELASSSEASTPCPPHVPDRYSETEDVIKWPESKMLAQIDKIVNEKLGPAGINKIVRCATNGTGHVSIPLLGGRMKLSIGNIDSWYDLRLLIPAASESPFSLKNALGLGACQSWGGSCRPLSLTLAGEAEGHLTLPADFPSKLALAQATFLLSDTHLDLDAMTKVSRNSLNNLMWGQLGTKGCLATTLQMLQLVGLNASMSNVTLVVVPGGGAPTKTVDLTSAVAKLIDIVTSSRTLQSMNSKITSLLGESEAVCANGGVSPNSGGSPPDTSSPPGYWAWIIGLICGSSVMCLATAVYMYRRKRKESDNIDKFQEKVQMLQTMEAWRGEETGVTSISLMQHPSLSRSLRLSMPILLLVNICVFIYSNSAPDAVTVMTTIQAGDTVNDTVQVFSFSFASTVQDMWDAKVYFLAIVICAFTGIWPYAKLLVMAASWALPPSKLSVETRYALLRFVDAYGKYSLVDFFVMVLMLCAFFFKMHLGPPDQQINVTLFTVPRAGFYSFLASTILSLVLGHIVLAAHRHVNDVEGEEKAKYGSGEEQHRVRLESHTSTQQAPLESLCHHPFELSEGTARNLGLPLSPPKSPPLAAGSPSRQSLAQAAQALSRPRDPSERAGETPLASNYRLHISTNGCAIVCIALIADLALVLFGTWVNSFSFSIEGLTGWLLKEAATVEYSYDYVGVIMPVDSGTPNDWRMRTMQVCYFAFGVGMPTLLCGLVAVAWAMPLSLRSQERLFVTVEVVNAWASLDVFCLAILAALFQIRQFASFIVGDKCDALDQYLALFMDPALDGDDVCFDVETSLLTQSWVLFLAAAIVFFVAHPSLLLLDACVEERKRQSRRRSESTCGVGVGAGVEAGAGGRIKSNSRISLDDMTRPLLLEDIVLDKEKWESVAPGSPSASGSASIFSSSLASSNPDNPPSETRDCMIERASPSPTLLSRAIDVAWWLSLVEVWEGRTRINRAQTVMSRSRNASRVAYCDVSVTEH